MPKCQYCEKDFKNQGGVNLHEKIHCPKRPGQATAGTGGHKHSFRLLSPKVPAERKAIEAGYSEVCSECEEVI